jgi:hypothetical protein
MVGANVVGVISDAGESGAADPPHDDANSMTVISNKEQKRTNLCWPLNKSLFRI